MTDHALLLVNLGSPASTSVADVRRYLNQFLMDPYVVDLPWPVRRLLVSLILIKRPEQSAHAYGSIWWEEGSPLVVLTRRLQSAMVEHWPHGPVEIAMRYGQPALPEVLERLAGQGVRKVTLAPLYPQFADSTVTTVVELAKQVISERQLPLQMRVLQPFYEHPEYIEALAASARPYLEQDYDHLLLSFHGLPERHLKKLFPKGNKHDLRTPIAATVHPPRCVRCVTAGNAWLRPKPLRREWAYRMANGLYRSSLGWGGTSGSSPTPRRGWMSWPRPA